MMHDGTMASLIYYEYYVKIIKPAAASQQTNIKNCM